MCSSPYEDRAASRSLAVRQRQKREATVGSVLASERKKRTTMAPVLPTPKVPSSSAPHAVIIGAGVAGLSVAVRLASRGLRVSLFEKESSTGGKMRTVELLGEPLDAGPTVLTMRWVLEELFSAAGESLQDWLELRPLTVLARHRWRDGSLLDLFADREASWEAIRSLAGAKEADGFRAFCEYGDRIREAVTGPFLRSPRPSFSDLFSLGMLRQAAAVARIDAMRSMEAAIEGFFQDERLRMLFGRYATYSGSSPWHAPGTLNVISSVEQQGVWVPRGGMHAVAQALERLALARHVELHRGTGVTRILVEGGRAAGIELADGRSMAADVVITNGDVADLPSLLGERPVPLSDKVLEGRSLSAVVLLALAEPEGLSLEHHNVLFSSDYPREFDELFRQRRHPQDPTLYLCAQDRGPFGPAAPRADSSQGTERPRHPTRHERLLILANAPATGDLNPSASHGDEPWIEHLLSTLRRSGLSLKVQAHHLTTPEGFARLFPSTGGSLYGPASHGMMSAFAKAHAQTKLPGLFAVGGSAHPGAGVPMVMLSAAHAERAILQALPSTWSSRPRATPGGTWTPSATTGSAR